MLFIFDLFRDIVRDLGPLKITLIILIGVIYSIYDFIINMNNASEIKNYELRREAREHVFAVFRFRMFYISIILVLAVFVQ